MNAAAVEPGGDLPGARRRLALAISALIDPKPVTIHRDDGTTPITWIDSLLDQLLEAVAGGGDREDRGTFRSTIPVWADVLDFANEISTQIAEWHPEWPLPDAGSSHPTPTVIARLQALQARKWRPQDADLILGIARQLDAFTAKIRDLLNPEPVIYLMAPDRPEAAACTACGARHVWKQDSSDNNRPVRQPALRVTKDGCRCQACHASWEPGQLRILAAALGYPLPAGVLE